MSLLPGLAERQLSHTSSYASPVAELEPASNSVDEYNDKTPGFSEKDDSLGDKYDLEHGKIGETNVLDYTPETREDELAGVYKTWGDLSGISPADQERFFPEEGVRVGLKQRHIQMIALAGAIGTGLFLGIGKSLVHAGPVLLLLGYLFTSCIVFSVMWSLGVLSATMPVTGAWVRHAEWVADDALATTAGWNILYSHAISVPNEITAAVTLIQFWTDLSPAIFVTILGLAIVFSNTMLVRIYGETEFIMSMMKLLLIVGCIIFGICIDLGAGPNGHRIGFEYWRHGGAFAAHYLRTGAAGRWYGFWSVLTGSVYSFSGIETIAIAASETASPRRSMRQATKRIFIRIALCYILAIFVITLIVRSTDPLLLSKSGGSSASPFVVAAKRAGVKVLPSFINAVVITSAWSSGNSSILAASRTAMTMARMGKAPAFFLKTHRWGVPWVGVTFACMWIPLAYMCVAKSSTMVFGWLSSIVSSCALWGWGTICINSLCFHYGMKKQGIHRSELPWGPWGQPFFGWFGLVTCIFVLLTGGFSIFVKHEFSAQQMVSSYCSPVLNLIIFFSWKLIKRTKWVKSEDVPIRPWIIQSNNNPEPKPPRKPVIIRMLTFLWA